MLKRLGTVLAMIFLGASPSFAAGVALFPASPPLEPSQIQATLNSLIVSMNTAFAAQGTGTIAQGISVTAVASSINQLSITPSATGNPVLLTVGGSAPDTNSAISLSGRGTGAVLIGGTTTTLAGLQVAQPANRVNDVVITPGATAVVPTIACGGAGADTNIGCALLGNGTGSVYLGGSTAANAAVAVAHGTANVNQIILTGTNTGTAPSITVGGSGADATRNLGILAAGANGIVTLGTTTTCSGTTTATCQGQRAIISVTGLTTAASTLSAAMTVTNASVSATSLVYCQVNIYAGTGVPVAVNVSPGSGTYTFNIQNVSTGAALNATVPVSCTVMGA